MFAFDYESYRQEDGYFYYTYIVILTKGSLKDHYYLGQHRTRNFNDNYKGSGKKLLSYYKKYPNDFVFEILNFYRNIEELNDAEKLLIEDRYKDDELCLNLVAGGRNNKRGIRDTHLTDEHKQKISNAHKGMHLTDEIKQKISNSKKGQIPWNKGKHLSDEYKQKLSNAHKGKNKGQIPWIKGKHHTDESRKKMSEALKGKNKGKVPWIKGRHLTDEHKQKISNAKKGMHYKKHIN